MFATRLATAALLFITGVGAIGIGALVRQARAGAPQDGAAQPVHRGMEKSERMDGRENSSLEDRIYAELRANGRWKSPAGDWVILVKSVQGRRLLDLVLKQHDPQGAVHVFQCREAELRVHHLEKILQIHMRDGQATLGDGSEAWFTERVCYWELPPSFFGVATGQTGRDVERKLRLAFGEDCKEVAEAAIKVEIRSKNLVLAANSFRVEPDGRVRFAPCWMVYGGAAGESMTLRCREATFTFDGPVRELAEMGRRRVLALEPSGNVRLSFGSPAPTKRP